jgi:hypothetical protein
MSENFSLLAGIERARLEDFNWGLCNVHVGFWRTAPTGESRNDTSERLAFT